jgi:hypothetical protein
MQYCYLARKMESTEVDKLPELDVEKAMKAVQNYKQELENLKTEGLTDKQAQALAKFTQEILSPNEAET